MKRNNRVSAVIPTHSRPHLVLRAVQSALAQTYEDLEVIVVLDGPDSATSKALATVSDSRLRVVILPEAHGAQSARNAGIQAAQGDWIALLDDDDEWLPEKTELQMTVAMNSPYRYPVVSSQYSRRAGEQQFIWPRRVPYEPLSEYMLARSSFSMGEGHLCTCTLLFPRDLFALQPFTSQLKRCHEVDWVLRVSKIEGVGIEFIPRLLAIVYQQDDSSITNVPDWRASFDWVESVREMITARAYASYLAITVSSQAARARDWAAFPLIARLMLTRGKPKGRDLMFFLGAWFVPRKIQLAVRRAGSVR